MSKIEAIHPSRGKEWLIAASLALLLNPVMFTFVGPPFDPSSFIAMLLAVAPACVIIYLVGFFSGPVGFAFSAYYLLHKIAFGLSEDEKSLLSCLPNRFEGILDPLAALLFPAAALSTFFLFNRYVLKKSLKPWHAFSVFTISALMAYGALWRISILQQEASLVPC